MTTHDQDSVRAWANEGISDPWIQEWKAHGFDPESAGHWQRVGYAPKYAADLASVGASPEDAQAWNDRGWRQDLMAAVVQHGERADILAGRWDALLDRWRGSVQYMLESGFTMSDTAAWLGAGLSPHDVEQTVAAGGTAARAAALTQAGLDPGSVAAAVRRRVNKRQAAEWASLHLDARTLVTLLDQGATVAAVRALIADGATPGQLATIPFGQLSPRDATAWARADLLSPVAGYLAVGVTAPLVAQAWEIEGFRPDMICGFVKEGVSPADAASLSQRGYIDSDDFRHDPPLAGTSWNSVLGRSQARRDLFSLRRKIARNSETANRFWYAVRNLTLHEQRESFLFSDATHTFSFVAGEVVNVAGCGWGSHSGTWVRGSQALRLICRHMGLEQPRRLKGEDEAVDLDLLDADARRQRAQRYVRLQ